MRIPRPSSVGVPIRQAASGTWASGQCSATIASLWMNPPVARITPPRVPDGAGPVVGPYAQADHVPAVDDQRLGAGVGHHASAAGRHGGTEALHEEAAGGVDVARLVTARRRGRDLVERVSVLTATEEQASVIGRFTVRLVAERRPERDADRDQPVEVVRRTLAVGVHAIVVHAGPEGGPEERRHVLRRVLEAAGILEGRAASQVDETTGVGRRPTGSRCLVRRPARPLLPGAPPQPQTCPRRPGPPRPRRPSRRSEPRRPRVPGSAPSPSSGQAATADRVIVSSHPWPAPPEGDDDRGEAERCQETLS